MLLVSNNKFAQNVRITFVLYFCTTILASGTLIAMMILNYIIKRGC